jgi:hypothetical protein
MQVSFDCGSGCKIALRLDSLYFLSSTYIEITETAHPLRGGSENNDREIQEVDEVEVDGRRSARRGI